MTQLPVEKPAGALYRARRDRIPVPPLTEARPEMTAVEAYAVQRRVVDLLQADGEGEIVGYTLGRPGALHAAVPLAAGDVFLAEFDWLGPVGLVVSGALSP